jgi:hypothetical protein
MVSYTHIFFHYIFFIFISDRIIANDPLQYLNICHKYLTNFRIDWHFYFNKMEININILNTINLLHD